MNPLAPSWRNYLLNLGSADARHRRMAEVNSVALHGLEPEEAVQKLSNDPDSVVIYLATNGVIKFLFQHGHVGTSWLDGNENDSVYVAHAGEGSLASVYEVDEHSIFTDVEFGAPTATNLRNAQDPMALQAPDQNPTVCNIKQAIVIPPFLVEALLGLQDRSPSNVFASFQRAITAFDEEHHGAQPAMPSARDNCLYALQFVWGCCHGHINQIPREESDRTSVIEWSRGVHQNKIAPVAPVQALQNDVAQSLLETNRQSLQLMQQQQTIAMEREEERKKKANKVSKLSPTIVKVLRLAQIDANEVEPDEVAKSADTFYNLASVSAAATHIRDSMRSKGEKIQVSQGLATFLHSGLILRDNRTIPGGLTLFGLHPKVGFDTSSSRTAVSLSLQVTHGQGLSSDAIKALSKLVLSLPSSIDGLKSLVEYSSPLLAMLFTEASPLVEFVEDVYNYIDENEDYFAERQTTDPQFATKVLYSIDDRIQRFLYSCSRASTRANVNDAILDANFLESVPNLQFHVQLPDVLAKQFTSGDTTGTESGDKKRRRLSDVPD